MTIPRQGDKLIGLTATDADGDKIGQVGQVYLDDGTGQPEWVTVSTGLFGTRQSFAPLYGCSVRDDQFVLAVPKQLVKEAPMSKTPATTATPGVTPTPGRTAVPGIRTPTAP
jgi:uncharacterized protein YrrD